MSALTLTQAKTALQNLKKDIADVSDAIFIEWCDFVNKFVYCQLINLDPERFIKRQNISVVKDTETYALPSDFRDIQRWGTGLYEQDASGIDRETRLTRTNFGSQQRGYYILGNNIVMTPKPTKSETIVLRYIPDPPAFTALTDNFTFDKTSTGQQIIPSEYLQFLRDALDTMYTIWDEEPGAQAYVDARFVRSLDEFMRHYKRESAAYGMMDFSVNF